MCRNMDVLHMEEEMVKEGNEITEMLGEICLLEQIEILWDKRNS